VAGGNKSGAFIIASTMCDTATFAAFQSLQPRAGLVKLARRVVEFAKMTASGVHAAAQHLDDVLIGQQPVRNVVGFVLRSANRKPAMESAQHNKSATPACA